MIYGNKFLAVNATSNVSFEESICIIDTDIRNISLLTEASDIMILTEGGVKDFFKNLISRVKEWITKALNAVKTAIDWIYNKVMSFIAKLIAALNKEKSTNESALLEASNEINMRSVLINRKVDENIGKFSKFVEGYGYKLMSIGHRVEEASGQVPDDENKAITDFATSINNELKTFSNSLIEECDKYNDFISDLSFEKTHEIHTTVYKNVDDALQFVAAQKKYFDNQKEQFKATSGLISYLKTKVTDPMEELYNGMMKDLSNGMPDDIDVSDEAIGSVIRLITSFYKVSSKYMSTSTSGISKIIKLYGQLAKENMKFLVSIGKHLKNPDSVDLDSVDTGDVVAHFTVE